MLCHCAVSVCLSVRPLVTFVLQDNDNAIVVVNDDDDDDGVPL